MDASEPSPASGLSFEDFLAGKPPAASASPVDSAAIVPPPLGDVDTDPASNQVAVNIRRELTHQLRAAYATVLDATFRVRAGGNLGEVIYHPDLIVDAGEPDRAACMAREPKVVFEVAVAGSERAAFIESWRIHEKLSTADVHVLVDPSCVSLVVRRREKGGGWQEEMLSDPDDTLFLPTIHCLLTLETIYEEAMSGGDEGRI